MKHCGWWTKGKARRWSCQTVTKSQLCCVPARRNNRISSLTWTAYLWGSSLLRRRFEIPSHSPGSCISHGTKERKTRGGVKRRAPPNQQAVISLFLPSAPPPQVPTGRRCLSVKSQVTTLLGEPSEGQHLIEMRMDKRKEKGNLQKVISGRRAGDLTGRERRNLSKAPVLCVWK